jgi:preprotein translocase subunit SecE
MARQTRQQRRARREQQADGGAPIQRARVRQQQPARPAPAPQADAAGRRPGRGGRRFLSESVGELKKVEWPGRPQLIQGVAVVLIACVIVGAYLWGADLVFKRLVQNVFLGQ